MTTPDTDIEPRYDTNGDPAEPDTLANLPVDHLHPADDNPRQHLGDLTELAATITAHGIIEPLVVHPRNIGGGWTIVAGHRRHAAAEATGEASGLKRLKQRPWDGAGDHRPCKKTDATHWYLAERDTTIIWARTAKADAKARAVTGDQPATEQPWERNQRIRAEVSERRADLLDRLPPAKLAELAFEWIFTQFDADRAVSLHPITFSAGADPLDVICYAALERIRDDATQEPSSTESWGWPIWDLWQRVAAAVAELDTPAVDEPAAGDEHADAGEQHADDAPGITHNATIPIAITLPEHLANAVHDLVEAQPSTATRPPWSTYNGRNDGDLCVTISQVKSPDKLLHALAYEIANRDGKHGRRGIVGTLIASINEVMGQ